MNDQYRPGVVSKPWGPLISPNYKEDEFTNLDVLIASIPWSLTLVNVILALWQIHHQTKAAKDPIRSLYLWMVWLELGACFMLGLLGYLHVLKHIPAMVCWSLQVMLLFQIIINRIRVIDVNRKRSRNIFIGVTVYITIVNLSAFVIWIPARMQISPYWEFISAVWDRTEKCLFLLVDAVLNWYFLRTVKKNLIRNGLIKYNKVVRFNQQIVVLSLLMDVMLIAATAIPKAFVYVQFHSLCYLVKLNIEMAMANLIKRVAISNFSLTGVANEFKDPSSYVSGSQHDTLVANHDSVELDDVSKSANAYDRQINVTTKYTVTHETDLSPKGGHHPSNIDTKIMSEHKDTYGVMKRPMVDIEESETKSLDSVTEVADSFRGQETSKRNGSDDEVVLVEKRGRW